ncbi:hypothetical protein REY30_000999 [Klebsiella quasipneumoniae]|nr:hypothetical protein [Klebsiella quasipneumoniae]
MGDGAGTKIIVRLEGLFSHWRKHWNEGGKVRVRKDTELAREKPGKPGFFMGEKKARLWMFGGLWIDEMIMRVRITGGLQDAFIVSFYATNVNCVA